MYRCWWWIKYFKGGVGVKVDGSVGCVAVICVGYGVSIGVGDEVVIDIGFKVV